MGLTGRSILGNELGKTGGKIFRAINPATGQELEPNYCSADAKEVDSAARMAAGAFPEYSRSSGKIKGALLRKIAEQIEGLGDDLVNRAVQETALPSARIKNEAARTCFQLRLFAEVVEEGHGSARELTAVMPRVSQRRSPIYVRYGERLDR